MRLIISSKNKTIQNHNAIEKYIDLFNFRKQAEKLKSRERRAKVDRLDGQ